MHAYTLKQTCTRFRLINTYLSFAVFQTAQATLTSHQWQRARSHHFSQLEIVHSNVAVRTPPTTLNKMGTVASSLAQFVAAANLKVLVKFSCRHLWVIVATTTTTVQSIIIVVGRCLVALAAHSTRSQVRWSAP